MGTAKGEDETIVEVEVEVATHACNTLHKQRINQATRRDANFAITWSQALHSPCHTDPATAAAAAGVASSEAPTYSTRYIVRSLSA